VTKVIYFRVMLYHYSYNNERLCPAGDQSGQATFGTKQLGGCYKKVFVCRSLRGFHTNFEKSKRVSDEMMTKK